MTVYVGWGREVTAGKQRGLLRRALPLMADRVIDDSSALALFYLFLECLFMGPDLKKP